MTSSKNPEIVIKGARTNNLKNVSLRIPHNKFIVVTGVSGSGKSSLVFEVIAKEGQRRYFETLPSFARQFLGKLNRPDVDEIVGLSPVISIGQRTSGMHARSTVGTMSDIYDLLRLLYARTGKSQLDIDISRGLFSFNSPIGKCKHCNGIGKEEEIDLDRLIVHPEKTIREGALAPTLPNGYIMYSQVTIDVLNQVCEAEGFSVDIPWKELTLEQKNIILNGSEKIKVPFGKHSLESRLKWTGIKAKPREEGFYKGMIPIMSDILRRDRNANILKYVHAITCRLCNGTRLNTEALSVKVHALSIAEVSKLKLTELSAWIENNAWDEIGKEVVSKIKAQLNLLQDLGLGHLNLNRTAKTLRASEIQRIRIANQILTPLSDVLYVFDEPSIGLHPEENERLIFHLKGLVQKGNTVIVVEHDIDTIRSADHIIEIGPKAGVDGGKLIFNGEFEHFLNENSIANESETLKALHYSPEKKKRDNAKNQAIQLIGCNERNLDGLNVEFQIGKLNVVSGKSGAGKSTLVKETLLPLVQKHLGVEHISKPKVGRTENLDLIDKLVFIDHSAIGKTPRSNPATYLGISDHIRDLFSKLPASKEKGFSKSRFSFNNKGGRCETCQGAGKTQIGMHFLGNVDLVCETCNGDRFNEETLAVKYKNSSIADVYKMSINEAVLFFQDDKKVLVGLKVLQEIGLGYLRLGQSSTTLSGGEAQRIKIANQLQKKDTGNTLYIIIEPSIGLHHSDIQTLLDMFERIKQNGNTIVCIEQDESVIASSDHSIELIENSECKIQNEDEKTIEINNEIILKGVSTHGLKNIDVSIPKNQLTVVTGLSGSGKSSLVYDTLFAEANARFTESLSTHNRSYLQQNSEAKIEFQSGLGPAIGINRKGGSPSKRSTVGTLSGIYDGFRLLYSRIAQEEGEHFTAQHFSFNHYLGACPVCEGHGEILTANPEEIIVTQEQSILDGAFSENKTLKYYTDSNGQFMAILKTVALAKNWDLNVAWQDLPEQIKEGILYGVQDEVWDVTWEYKTKARSGKQELKAKWLGFCNYVNDEFERKVKNKNITSLEELLHSVKCNACNGKRLKPELLNTTFLGENISEITELSIAECLLLISDGNSKLSTSIQAISDKVMPNIKTTLQTIIDLGLGYLSLNRSVRSLSGGERQRITLAGQLSSNLFGVTYVLDEPTIGLDAKQVAVLTKLLKKIVLKGNTVVVVEHDLSFIKNADYLIEMGPAAGEKGGAVIYQGDIAGIEKAPNSVTYKLLTHKDKIVNVPSKIGESFGVKGAFANNLKNIEVNFHAQQLIAVTGVSGSGKSSLVKEVLYRSWEKKRAVECKSVYGLEQFEAVELIAQTALHQSRLSTPASYTGVIEHIKTIFSKTEKAKELGFKKADFSYQSKKGKCTTCGGHGKLKTSMDFMSDIWLTCDACKGLRYNQAILEVKFQDKSIGEVLKMSVQQALAFFSEGKITQDLSVLEQVGVGHLGLGQSGNTLSGGEAQRLKLATAMLQKGNRTTLYLFDEPSTGLHYFDILKLVTVFQELVEQGNTVLFIEHNTTLIEVADELVKLGPGSGVEGGEIV